MTVEVDAVKLMIDGCACPCGADGLHPLWTDDGVGEAILELEGWGDWWVGPGGDYPFAPGGALYPPASLCTLARQAWDEACMLLLQRRGRRRRRMPENELQHGLPFFESAALLRDGWRPTGIPRARLR